VRALRAEDLLPKEDAIQSWDEVSFPGENKSVRKGTLSWRMTSSAEVFGFCLFWECELVPGISLSNSPSLPPTHWDQVFMPVPEPLKIAARETLELELKSDSSGFSGCDVAWRTRLKSATGKTRKEFSQCLRKGGGL
jgi:hypothetical protein